MYQLGGESRDAVMHYCESRLKKGLRPQEPCAQSTTVLPVVVVHGRDVRIVETDVHRYGRTVGEVYIGEQRVTLALVTAGLAWHYKKYSDDTALNDAEIEAREAGRGLWADPRHVAAWEWRRLSKDERDELR